MLLEKTASDNPLFPDRKTGLDLAPEKPLERCGSFANPVWPDTEQNEAERFCCRIFYGFGKFK
jgi:hypothetical protein